ncbi:DUF202 domain-containing protein [Sphingomonas sinipercae]|uniref:DUF202 domain-containing protein n=1 Tax=Sphingomonas sinipercae TaxID=2714944 RepID=A0A6G7ZPZ6_9SPHN|nr:DUF202 domain-containing protein [Sphingomonas sinipercae]QIL03013.1 DUF202 domain-containing protein [Sphingomonas sinipercae]
MDREDEVENPSRTELAEDRTILANERTFAGWMRTSLACVALGVGFLALYQKIEPGWVPRSIASGFLMLAIVVIVAAERRAAAVMKKRSAHVIMAAKAMNLKLLAAAVSIGAVALIVASWVVDFR